MRDDVTPIDGSPLPLLALDQVERHPEVPTQLVGIVRFGGHRLRVVLDFARSSLGVIEHVDMPKLLAMHEPSQRAVISAMTRIADGEAVPLPCDLTGEIAHSDPPFPLQPLDEQSRQRLDAAAAQVDLEVCEVERSGSEPERVRARLVLDGRPLEVEAELYAAPGAIPVMRWIAGPPLDELNAAQRHAIHRALSQQHR